MANTAKWTHGTSAPASPLSVLTTELNALANNTASAASATIANATNKDLYADLWVHLASLTPAAGGYLTLYILESIDGSTFPAATGSVLRNQPTHVLATMQLNPAVGAQDVVVRNVLLPPADFKIVLDNQSGVALAGTLNTVKLINSNLNLNA